MQKNTNLNNKGKTEKIAVITAISILLLALSTVCCIVFASRDDGIIKVGTFYAKPVENGYMIVGTDGSEGQDLAIPEQLNGVNVVAIDDEAFKNSKVKNFIVFPTVKEVGTSAFDSKSDFKIYLVGRKDLSDMSTSDNWHGGGEIIFQDFDPTIDLDDKPVEAEKPIITPLPPTNDGFVHGDASLGENKDSKLDGDADADIGLNDSTGDAANGGGYTNNTDKDISKAKSLSKIEIASPPLKTRYIEGSSLDKAGMIVFACYTDGSTQRVTSYDVSISGKLVKGTSSFTVTYKEGSTSATAKQSISVVAKTPTGLTITSQPTKREYLEGSIFDKSGMTVQVAYDNGDKAECTEYNISSAKLIYGQKDVRISYAENGKTVDVKQNIVVNKKSPAEIKLSTSSAAKTSYIEGQIFDKTGLKIEAVYDNGDKAEVSDIITPTAKLVFGQTKVTVSYKENGKTVSLDIPIKVVKKTPAKLVIDTEPAKVDYTEGNVFNPSGMIVKATYDNGDTLAVTGYVYPTAKLSFGQTEVKISYSENGKTVEATQEIKVVKRLPVSISIKTPPTKTEYIEGNIFDKKGMTVEAAFDNGDVELVTSYTVPTDKLIYSQLYAIVSFTENNKTVTVNQPIKVIKKSPAEIRLSTSSAAKTSYIEGQIFDKTGLKIEAVYDNGDKAEVSDIITPAAKLVFGQTKVTVSYKENGKTVSLDIPIKVVKKTPTKLVIDTEPAKVDYTEGNVFNPSGMIVKATYDNGDTLAVTGYVYPTAKLSFGQTEVKISYSENGKTVEATQEIKVVKRLPVSISIKTPPTKTEYIEGNTFDKKGMTVEAAFDNGDVELVTSYTVPASKLAYGQVYITVSYAENGKVVSINQAISVKKKSPTEIKLTTSSSAKTDYIEGQIFDKTGLKIEAVYDNGDKAEVSDIITPAAKLVFGQTKVTVSYKENGKTVSLDIPIKVVKKTPTKLTVTSKPIKVEYIEGNVFNPSGMIVKATYDNGDTLAVTGYVYPTAKLSFGQTEVKISYSENGKTVEASQEIKVVKRLPVSIRIKAPPTKTEYIEGNTFDKKGMTVEAAFDNGDVELVTSYTVPASKLAYGQVYITVSYAENGKAVSINQAISVKKKSPTEIKLTTSSSAKTDYIEGQIFDKTGLKIEAIYDNGDKAEVSDIITPTARLVFGQTKVTVSYKENGKTVSLDIPIKVVKKTPTKLTVTSKPIKVEYIEGNVFNPSGMIVKATYDNGDTLTVTGYVYPTAKLSFGQTEVKISYSENGKTVEATQEIKVVKRLPVSIRIKTPPAKTEYIEGNTFDKKGMTVEAAFNNGDVELVTSYTAPASKLIYAQLYVDISYSLNGKTVSARQPITVLKKSPSSLRLSTSSSAKTSYIEGQIFDKTGLKIEAVYDNGDKAEVSDIITPAAKLVFGQTKVTVSYKENGKTVSLDIPIKVVKKTPTSIRIKTPPSKMSYTEGEVFNKNGMIIEATYDNGDIQAVTGYAAPTAKLLMGQRSITISYTENGRTVTAAQEISVIKKVPALLTIKTPPTQTQYVEGTLFAKAGMVVEVTYNNGDKAIVTNSITHLNNPLVLGQTQIAIGYEENGEFVACYQAITVIKKVPSSIRVVTPPTKTSYIEQTVFNKSGMVIEVTYNNGDKANSTSYTVPAGELSFGTTAITISYTENGKTVTASLPIKVTKRALSSLTITSPPTKTNYSAGLKFKPAGMVVRANYNNGKTANVTGYTYSTARLAQGTTAITITYTENGVAKAVNQPITVGPQLAVYQKYTAIGSNPVYQTGAEIRHRTKRSGCSTCGTQGQESGDDTIPRSHYGYKKLIYEDGIWKASESGGEYDRGVRIHFIVRDGKPYKYIETNEESTCGNINHGGGYTIREYPVLSMSYSSYQQGIYLADVTLTHGSVPANGAHSDGNWYVFKSLIQE